MKVNFHGLKNMGGLDLVYYGKEYTSVTVKLTNDKNGKDLNDFKELLRDFPNDLEKDTVTITMAPSETDSQQLYINDCPVDFEEDNAPIISDAGNLLKRICNHKGESVVESNLVNTFDGYRIFSPEKQFNFYEITAQEFEVPHDKKKTEQFYKILNTDMFKIANIYDKSTSKSVAGYMDDVLNHKFNKAFGFEK